MSSRVRLSLAHLTVLDAGPVELIEAAAAGGFDAIGLRIVPPMPTDRIVPVVGDEGLIHDIENRLRGLGLAVLDVEAFWLTPEIRIDDMKPAVEVGARLGAKYLLAVGNDSDLVRTQHNFSLLCGMARSFGMDVALEPMSYCRIGHLAEAVNLLRAAQQDNAKLLIDALHLYRSGGHPRDLARLDPELFPYVHLCDARASPPKPEELRVEGRSGRFYPGEGELPLTEFLSAFPSDIPIAVEAPCARYAKLSPTERSRLCGEATRALLRMVRQEQS